MSMTSKELFSTIQWKLIYTYTDDRVKRIETDSVTVTAII